MKLTDFFVAQLESEVASTRLALAAGTRRAQRLEAS